MFSGIGARMRAVFDNGVGAQAHLVRVGWDAPFGGLLQAQLRTVDNGSSLRSRDEAPRV